MKLIANGEIGIYIDADYVSTLTTPALIEEELNNVVLGNYDPVVRENDSVVNPSDYIAYLKMRKQQLQSAMLASPQVDFT